MNLVPTDPDTAAVAGMLIAADWLSTPSEVRDFFLSPARWQREVTLWVGAGRPGVDDTGWALFVARLEAAESSSASR